MQTELILASDACNLVTTKKSAPTDPGTDLDGFPVRSDSGTYRSVICSRLLVTSSITAMVARSRVLRYFSDV
jgi:hypothetical protein